MLDSPEQAEREAMLLAALPAHQKWLDEGARPHDLDKYEVFAEGRAAGRAEVEEALRELLAAHTSLTDIGGLSPEEFTEWDERMRKAESAARALLWWRSRRARGQRRRRGRGFLP